VGVAVFLAFLFVQTGCAAYRQLTPEELGLQGLALDPATAVTCAVKDYQIGQRALVASVVIVGLTWLWTNQHHWQSSRTEYPWEDQV
jgi:hypothetical protein